MSMGLLVLIFLLMLMGFMGYTAKVRGYNPFCWILAAGLIGLVVLEVLPRPGDADTPEDKKKRIRDGNIAGLLLSLLSLAPTLFKLFVRHM